MLCINMFLILNHCLLHWPENVKIALNAVQLRVMQDFLTAWNVFRFWLCWADCKQKSQSKHLWRCGDFRDKIRFSLCQWSAENRVFYSCSFFLSLFLSPSVSFFDDPREKLMVSNFKQIQTFSAFFDIKSKFSPFGCYIIYYMWHIFSVFYFSFYAFKHKMKCFTFESHMFRK